MIPMLAWFITIVLIALIAFLAIKFLALRILLALILTLPILISFSFCVLRRSPVIYDNKGTFFENFVVASEGGDGQGNILAAFKQAKANGADTVKMDVRMTKDGMLILFKDPAVYDYNTTYKIEETHWVQLGKFRPYGGNISIMTFDDAVSWCVKNGLHMIWNLPAYPTDLLIYLKNKINQEGLYNQVAVTTDSGLTALKMRCSDTKLLIGLTWRSNEHSVVNGTAVGSVYTAWIYSTLDSFTYWGIRSLLLPEFLGIDFLVMDIGDADRALIDEAKTYSIYTVISGLKTQVEKSYFAKQLGLPMITEDPTLMSTTASNNKKNGTVKT